MKIYDHIKREHLFVFLILLSALIVFNSFDDQFGYTGLTVGVASNYVTGNSFIETIGKYIKNPFGGVVGGTAPTFPCTGSCALITADDEYTLYLNGQKLKEGSNWRGAEYIDLTGRLVNGQNLIAIDGYDDKDDEGILIEVWHNGRIVAKSDNTWKTYVPYNSIDQLNRPNRWNTRVEFDDSSWTNTFDMKDRNRRGREGQNDKELVTYNGVENVFSADTQWMWNLETREGHRLFRKIFNLQIVNEVSESDSPQAGQDCGSRYNLQSLGSIGVPGGANINSVVIAACDGDSACKWNSATTICETKSQESSSGQIEPIIISADKGTINVSEAATLTASSNSVSLFRWSILRENDAADQDCFIAYGSTQNAGEGPVITNPVLIRGARAGSCTVAAVDNVNPQFVATYVIQVTTPPAGLSVDVSSTVNVGGRVTATIAGGSPTYRVSPFSDSRNICRIVVPIPNSEGTAFVGGSTFAIEGLTAGSCVIRITDNASPSQFKDVSITVQDTSIAPSEVPCSLLPLAQCTQQSSRCEIIGSGCRERTIQDQSTTVTINPPSGLTGSVSGNNIVLTWNAATVSTSTDPLGGFAVLDNQITGNAGLFDSIANFFKGIFGIETRGTLLTTNDLVYDVWRKEAEGQYNVLRQSAPCSVSSGTCSYTDSTAQAGRTYNYKVGVRARTEIYYSDAVKFSNEVSVSVPSVSEVTYNDLDFNGDGRVEITVIGSTLSGIDGVLFNQHFGATTSSANWDVRYDLIRDGRVDNNDFFKLAELLSSRELPAPQACNTYSSQNCPTDRCQVVNSLCADKSDVTVVEDRPITIASSSDTVEVDQAATLTANSGSVSRFRWSILNYNPSNPICAIAHHGIEDGGPYISSGAPIRGKNPGTCQVAVTDDVSTDPRKYVGVYTLNVIAPIRVTASPDTTRVGQTSILTVTGGVTPYRASILTEAGGSCELISSSTSSGNTFEIRALTTGTCRVGIVDNRGRTYDSSVVIQSGGLEICDNNTDDDGDNVVDKLDKDCVGSYVNIVSVIPPTRDVLVDTNTDFLCGILIGGQSADLSNALQYCVDGKIGDTSCSSKSIISGGRVLFENCNVGATPRVNQTVVCSANSLCNAPPTTALGNATLTARFNVVELDICEDGEIGDGLDITSFKVNKNKYKAGDEIEVDVKVKSLFETRDVTVETLLYNIDDRETVTSKEDTQEVKRSDSEEFNLKLTIPSSVQDENKHKVYIKVLEDGREDEQCKFLSKSITIEEGTGCTDRDKDGSCRSADCDDNNANIYPTAAEICSDSIDNNCNSLTDGSDPDCSSACVSGQTRSCGVNIGECNAGTETCVSGRWNGVCVGSVSPVTEVCSDRRDNDCDGLVDCGDSSCSGNTVCGSQPAIDVDNDGLEDEWEMQYFTTLAFGAEDDSDGDKYSNIKEFEAGTDPTNPNSHPGSRTWIWALIFIAVLLIIAGAVYYLYFSKPKSTNLGTYTFKNEARVVKNDKKLNEYVKNSLRKGFTRTQIRNALRAKGWTDEEISDSMGRV